jgi:hypothetical protein
MAQPALIKINRVRPIDQELEFEDKLCDECYTKANSE